MIRVGYSNESFCFNISSSFRAGLKGSHGEKSAIPKRQMSTFIRPRRKACLRSLVLITALLFSGSAASAELAARLSRNPVSIDESFQLILESDGQTDSDPDFSVLEQDFQILSQSRSQNIQMINAKVTRSTSWHLKLLARRTGRLTIPAIPLGGDSSKPLSILVQNAAPPQPGLSGDDIFLKVEAEPAQAFQGEQILLNIQLYRAVSTDNATLTQPETDDPDILIKKLGEDDQYETHIGGRRYLAVERRYALFTRKTGTLNLQPLVFQGEVIDPGSRRGTPFGRFGSPGQFRRIQSNPISIEIKPAPTLAAGNSWLPSSNLQLVEQWSRDSRQFTIGEPVTRTLTLFADGLTSAQLPDIKIELPAALKQYPDQPLLRDRESREGITGIRQVKVAIVPNRSGHFTLPAINLNWWNLVENRMETAVIPEQQIEVTPAAGDQQRPVAAAPPATSASPRPAQQVSASNYPPAAWPVALTLFFALGWLGTSIAWWYRAKRVHRVDSVNTPNRSKPEKADLRALRTACLGNEPEAAGRALLAWGGYYWPDAPPLTLGGIAEKTANAGLKKEIALLERSLYAETSSPWQGAELWKHLDKEPKADAGKPQTEEPVVPLHPV